MREQQTSSTAAAVQPQHAPTDQSVHQPSLKRVWNDNDQNVSESDDESDDEEESENETVRGVAADSSNTNASGFAAGGEASAVESSSGNEASVEQKSSASTSTPPFKRPMTLHNSSVSNKTARSNMPTIAFQESVRQKSGTGGGQ